MTNNNVVVLNLSTGFIPYANVNRLDYEVFTFSGGERHIKIKTPIIRGETKAIITHRINSSEDLMTVLLAKDALEHMGINEFELVMPYIPYARQDRKCADGESFSLKVFSDIINSQNFTKVTVLDAHSDVAPALIHRSENIDNTHFVRQAVYAIDQQLGNSDNLVLISPDAGSNKKCNKLFSSIPMFNKLVKCDKVRDLDSGKLSGFAVFADDLEGAPCIMVDDICDGGGTFMGLAEELKKKNAGPIFLFVTHGIFSKGLGELVRYFDRIYTTNSIKNFSDAETIIKQFNIKLD